MTPDHCGRLGATRVGDGAWSFVVWAPLHEQVALRLYDDDRAGESGGRDQPMRACGGGYHAIVVDDAGEDPTYRFVLADGTALADPASRWQPAGVHGPSRGVDPARFSWRDDGFHSRPLSETVLYELHVGTFTKDGTFDAAIDHLAELADLGVTAVEPMPIAQFPGQRNWGYDGVFPFAAQDSYGGPAGFQRFVEASHRHGLAVVLDVVYNHLGPEGNVLEKYGPYFTDRYVTPWGPAVNVAESGSDEVRRYFTENAHMWLRDFHVDGLRLDAVHGIVDPTSSPFLRELTASVERLGLETGRPLFLIAESADNNPAVVSSAAVGGLGFDAQWNDDFHHALHSVLTGESAGYYVDYGRADHLARAINDGFVYRGDYSTFRGRRHGSRAATVPHDRLVVFSQNHDQVGNRPAGDRLSTLVEPAALRLAAAVTLLSPFVPLMFMGEEYGETAPFPYFIDHGDPDLVEAVRRGRAEEFARETDLRDPADAASFAAARLNREQRTSATGAELLGLYRRLLAARRHHPVLCTPGALETKATATGGALTILRRSPAEATLGAFNLTGDEVSIGLDAAAPTWHKVLDSGLPPDHGPDDVAGDGVLRLPAYGFCLYATSRPAGS